MVKHIKKSKNERIEIVHKEGKDFQINIQKRYLLFFWIEKDYTTVSIIEPIFLTNDEDIIIPTRIITDGSIQNISELIPYAEKFYKHYKQRKEDEKNLNDNIKAYLFT